MITYFVIYKLFVDTFSLMCLTWCVTVRADFIFGYYSSGTLKLYVNIYPLVIGGLNIFGGIFLKKPGKILWNFVSPEKWEP